ncbi:phosphate signaling complex PhoU family protein [Methermicoccus shengliensis]|uniref:Phosphate uptake regulator PhoU n=1 Tax=Methermicoccus shengliensis TaxID=660064 RepID=A0A832VMM0_9EURY|nr:MAG: hypothetical protein XD46_0064 [Euryarchaeota archaeon 55_53]KUK30364.1 MAG: hypothetical protein XD62_0539 [Methanosarcinales archeaon 56_1174]HIH69406.1 phosphate uptake regulator PhoU [Methermicoccus shengliensis]
METRKIYLSGGSTYVVSLPKRWVERHRLSQGDSLIVSEENDAIVFSPSFKSKPPTTKTIKCSKIASPQLFEKTLIAYYLAGYDTIALEMDVDDPTYFRKVAWAVAQRLIGVEIIEDTLSKLSIEVLLDPERIPITKTLRKLSNVCHSMMRDTVKVFENADTKLASDMQTRENEVDRLYFLAIRQLKEAASSSQLAKKLDIQNTGDAIEYRVVVQNIERISDHMGRISKNVLSILEVAERGATLKEFVDVSSSILSLYERALQPIISREYSVPPEVFEMENSINEMLLHRLGHMMNAKDIPANEALMRRGILSSLDRIKSYTIGIAESVINLQATAGDMDT